MDLNIRTKVLRLIPAIERLTKRSAMRSLELLDDTRGGRNQGSTILCTALLAVVDDLKGFVLDPEVIDAFDLKAAYSLDASPLFNLNEVDPTFVATVRALYEAEEVDIESQCDSLLEGILEIKRDRLLGADTAGKLAYVRDVTGVSLSCLQASRNARQEHLQSNLGQLQNETLRLLMTHARRVGDTRRSIAVRRMLDHVRQHALRYDLHSLCWNHPSLGDDFGRFCRCYADEIVQHLAARIARRTMCATGLFASLAATDGHGIEVAYARRDLRFLSLGDVYGDCTARRVRSQVEPEVANIHWTVYSWLLDPYYRVLEVLYEGEPVIKGHLLPLIVCSRPVLMLDAIETVPKLRDTIRGQSNPHASQRLLAIRADLLAALLTTVRRIASQMRAEAVYVDKFSNTRWIRHALNSLPTDCYHVRDIEKPFSLDTIRTLCRRTFGEESLNDFDMEIQAINLTLTDQGLRQGFKEVAVLVGQPASSRMSLRGP